VRKSAFKDDPYFEEVLEIMAENRRKIDKDFGSVNYSI
jgi:hypothetical protein